MSIWFDILAIAAPLLAAGLLGAGLRGPLPHATLPVLFALMPASISLAYVAGAHGQALAGVAGIAGALVAMAGLATAVCTHDAQLAAAGVRSVAGAGGDALLLAGLPRTPQARWRRFERDLWAYIAAHGHGHGDAARED